MRETVTLKRLSICPCGYTVLQPEITLGTEYAVDRATIAEGFTYVCGGCGEVQQNIRGVKVSSVLNPEAPMRPLPLALFEEDEDA